MRRWLPGGAGEASGSRLHSTLRDPRMRTILGQVVLLAASIRLFDILLLKRYLDRPLVVAAWLVVLGASILVLRRAARDVPDGRRSALQRIWARLDATDLTILSCLVLLLFAQHFTHMRASADGRAYFLQTRSLVIDHDLDFTEDVATFGVALAGAGPDNPGGVTSYALGAPLAWTPFFTAAHAWLGVLNAFGAEYPRNGFFNPYQRAVGLGSLVYGIIALFLLARLLRRYHRESVVRIATVMVGLGSFAAWYMAVDATWSHAVSMFFATALIVYWDETRDDRSLRQWAVLGLTCGLTVMARWQNVFFLVLPAADLLRGLTRLLQADRRLGAWLKQGASVGFGAFVGFLPQMVFWRFARDGWLDIPSGEHPLYWDSPFAWETLFSLDRGVFTWTPLLAFAIIGLVPLARRQPYLVATLTAAFALQVYVNGTVWWGNHGFGARRFANCLAVFGLGLAAILDWLRARPLLAAATTMLPLVILNLFFMAEVRFTGLGQQGAVTFERMVEGATNYTGHPFSMPMNLWMAARYDSDLTLYQRMGSQTFNNLRIDVGSPGDERFLGGGWSHRESDGARSWRWSVGRETHVVFLTKAVADYRIEMRCSPFLFPDAPEQRVQVRVNGRHVTTLTLERGVRDYRIEVPADAMERRFNHMSFRFAYARSPSTVLDSEDPRELAVMFERLHFLRTS